LYRHHPNANIPDPKSTILEGSGTGVIYGGASNDVMVEVDDEDMLFPALQEADPPPLL